MFLIKNDIALDYSYTKNKNAINMYNFCDTIFTEINL